jgi:hypothetical protein
MMKKRLWIACITTIGALSASAHAECAIGYCRGIGTQVVQSATVDSTGVYFMMPTGANMGCMLIEGVFAKLDRVANPAFKEIYATYLSAVAQGQYFQIAVDNSATCAVAYIRVWN